ncbi:MAG: MmgE/PrpD family protein [Planctomycetes bacterium]|nr:MmgE/PrpD family protein [Planctomycetota bacterium]
MPTMTETIARWACDLKYDDLTSDAIDAAKRFLYDTLGCALGGYQTHDVKMFLEHEREMGGAGSCTIIGSGEKLSPVTAAMLNALMIRAMDYNDIYWKQDPSHPSDLLSAPLALAERHHLSGKDLIVGIVLAYEIAMRLCHIAVPGIRERGWHHATLMGYAAPIVAAKMIGLDWQKTQHAIGIAGVRCFTLGCAVAGKLTMMKNTVSPMATRAGVEAALLAQRGYTGPEGVIEGKEGMEHCLGQEWDYGWITDKLGDRFMITDCGMKSFPIEALMHSPVSATLALLTEHRLKAEDVKEVLIESIARAADILSDPTKYDPQSKESADHSLPYCIAAALAECRVTPLEFTEEKLWDQRLRSQMAKVKVVANDEFEKAFPAKQCARVTITTTKGDKYTCQVDVPKGDPRDPMTLDELQVKFDALAGPIVSEKRRGELHEAVFALESLDDVGKLMALTIADRQ